MARLKIFYGRVSSDLLTQDTSAQRQDEIGKSLSCDLVLIDRESGRQIEREKYTQLIDLIRSGQVEIVIATRSDRVGRNAAEMDYFYKLCVKHNVAWQYLDEPQLNSDSPWGYTQRKEAAHAAEMESIKLGIRQESAYRHAEEKGRVIARIIPKGYRVNAEKKFEIDWLLDDQSNAIAKLGDTYFASGELARRLIDLFLQHRNMYHAHKNWITWLLSMDPINEKEWFRWCKSRYESIRNWIENPVIRGNMCYGRYEKTYEENKETRTITAKHKAAPKSAWRIIYDTHPALVSQQESEEIDRLIQLNQSYGRAIYESRRDPEDPASLAYILRCECGKTMNASSTKQKGKKYRYYYCTTRQICPAKGIGEVAAVNQLIALIGAQAESILSASMRAITEETKTENAEVIKLKRERDKVLESFRATGMDVFLQAEKQLTQKITELESSTPPSLSTGKYDETFLKVIKDKRFWLSMPPVERHDLFRKIVKQAQLQDGQVVSLSLAL